MQCDVLFLVTYRNYSIWLTLCLTIFWWTKRCAQLLYGAWKDTLTQRVHIFKGDRLYESWKWLLLKNEQHQSKRKSVIFFINVSYTMFFATTVDYMSGISNMECFCFSWIRLFLHPEYCFHQTTSPKKTRKWICCANCLLFRLVGKWFFERVKT